MQSALTATPAFEGTDEERQLAEQVFSLARFHGRFFAATAPIGLKRDELAGALAARGGRGDEDTAPLAALIDASLAKNAAVFARSETADGVVIYTTTRLGTAPVEVQEDRAHSLPERFMNPVEVPPPPPPKPAPRIADAWAYRPSFEGLPDEPETGELTSPAELAALADIALAEARAVAEPAPNGDAADSAAALATVPAATPGPDLAGVPSPPEAAAMTVAPAEPPLVEPPDVGALPIEAVRAALAARLESDERFVSFGDRYYNEDLVDRYSRGDLRRIREYILEVTEPLSDDALLQDLFGRRSNDSAYEAARFSINYRLGREKRDFEFVGTRDSRLWSTSGLAPIGTTLRKASDLGGDFRLLSNEPPAEAVGNAVTHVLTFFEWFYGLLPLDGTLRQFFPAPYLEDQKTAVLRFDAPQLFATFLVEVRYPTANRGGYLVGFDEFYRENLAPGAVFTIERTPDNNGQFSIQYTVTAQREERLLQIDERRGRYVFRPQAVYCQLNDESVPSEGRYPRLAGAKPLDDRERRRPEVVVGSAFERAGENVGTKGVPRYWSAPEELLPVVNIERPFSLRTLREVLESPQFPQFSPDPETPGAFYFEPPAKGGVTAKGRQAAQDSDDEDDEE